MLTPVFMVTARKYFKLFLFERFLFLNWQLIYFLFRHFNLALPCTMGFLTKTFDSFTQFHQRTKSLQLFPYKTIFTQIKLRTGKSH